MIVVPRGSTHDLWAQLTNGDAGFDFRQSSPLVNRGTGGATLDLTANGSPTHTVGTGYTLNGSSQWLSDADNDLLDITAGQSMTVFFAGTASGAGSMSLVVKRNNVLGTPGSAAGWAMITTSRRIAATYSDGSTVVSSLTQSSGVGIFTDNVRFVAAARFGADVRAFLNGSVAGSTAGVRPSGSAANAEEMRVGRLSGTGTSYLTGSVGQVLVVRQSLSDADIATISALLANP